MKRNVLVTILFLALGILPCLMPSLAAEESWTLRTGLNFTPGLFYNQNWDPDYNGSAMAISLEHQNENLLLGAGLEAGYNFTGNYLFIPLTAGWTVFKETQWKLDAIAVLMPGLLLNRPFPYFLMAAEINARLSWDISPDFNLALSAGPRYTTSPAYSNEVAPLESIDLTLALSAGFVLGE